MNRNEIKFIKQLKQKKYRNMHRVFIVEGLKSIRDFLNSGFISQKIYSKIEIDDLKDSNIPIEIITEQQLRQLSFLKNPKDALAIFEQPKNEKLPDKNLIIALDNIQDPGNIGTIIRTADWLGIQNIVCSIGTVDVYNPKVVQASMGSLAHVSVHYTSLTEYFLNTDIPVFGACLRGKDLKNIQTTKDAILLIGNEGNGISDELKKYIEQPVYIPKSKHSKAESLNASIAAAILMYEFTK